MAIAPPGQGAAAAVPRAVSRRQRVAAVRRLVGMIGAAAAVPRGGSSRREPTPRGRGHPSGAPKGRRMRTPAEELERQLVRALRHGEFGFRGSFERGGYLSHADLKSAFQCSEELWQAALRLDRSAKKTRIDYSQPGFLRALQGHSTDCGHDLSYMAAAMDEGAVADLQRSHGKFIYHGTDVHVVESIVAEGLLPGGGPGGRLANHFVVGPMPTQWSESRGFRRGSNAVVQCNLEVLRKSGVRLFKGADGVLLADVVPAEAIFRILAADNQRGHYTEVLAEVGADRRLHLVRDLRAEAVEATAAAMDASAAAAGSADAPASAAPAEGAEVEDADTEPSSSDSELPDTTAPAVAKAEERSGAAEAAPQERSAADVDMATDMTEAAVADPSLTVGELVDKTKQKLDYMSAYMEGASRMVGFEGALSSRAGAEHRRVLEHAQELLQKSEEYLKERAAEAGAAASGAPSSGSAAPGSDARLLEGIDAFMGKAESAKAEDQDDPMEGPSKKEESSSEELVPDDPGRAHKSCEQGAASV